MLVIDPSVSITQMRIGSDLDGSDLVVVLVVVDSKPLASVFSLAGFPPLVTGLVAAAFGCSYFGTGAARSA